MIFALALFLSAYYLFVVFFLYRGLSRTPQGPLNRQRLSYSVLIACRNEEEHIEACVDSVFAQDYPADRFEVIVINDRSTDATPRCLERLHLRHPTLIIINVADCPVGVAPKKHALEQGATRAKNDILLFTDADCCVPFSWISAINKAFSEDTVILSGPTSYDRPPEMNRFFWGLQSMDFLSHGIVAAAAMGAGLPINTNANNLAVRKNTYQAASAFHRLRNVISGDDDLLLQAIAEQEREGIRYLFDPQAAVITAPSRTLAQIWEQRKRWSSKTVYYRPLAAAFLAGIFIYYLFILMLFMTLSWHPSFLPLWVALWLFKTGADFLLTLRGMARFRQWQLLPYFFPAALLHIPLIVGAVLGGLFGRFTWKGLRTGKRRTSC